MTAKWIRAMQKGGIAAQTSKMNPHFYLLRTKRTMVGSPKENPFKVDLNSWQIIGLEQRKRKTVSMF